MNIYKYEDLTIGDSECFTYKVTKEMIENFQSITGDVNPLHTDKEFARHYGFEDKVVYGLLSASLMSTLGGVFLPGKYCVIQQIDKCKFLKPVYVGDALKVKGTIRELHDSVKQMEIEVQMTNQSGEKVVKALLKVGFLE